jgi:hypothetical protein
VDPAVGTRLGARALGKRNPRREPEDARDADTHEAGRRGRSGLPVWQDDKATALVASGGRAMEDLEIITKVMDQHELLQEHLGSVSSIMSDRLALSLIEEAKDELGVNWRLSLSQRRDYLIASLLTVEQGMKSHYEFEEEVLPPLYGELLTQALILEHRGLIDSMRETIEAISALSLEELNHKEELEREALISTKLGVLRDRKLDHQRREEAVLVTLRRILEEQAKGKGEPGNRGAIGPK